jgi:hypothetical protein
MRSGNATTAAPLLALSLLDGLGDEDLAVFARRLLPHLSQQGQMARATGIPLTPWRRWRPSSACRTRQFVAPLRGMSCGLSSAGRGGSSRRMPLTSGRPRRTRTKRPLAGALLRSLPLPRRQVPRCGQFSAENAKRHAAEFAEARDERREDNASWWRSGLARPLAAARQEPCANVQHTPRRPRRRCRGPAAAPGRKLRTA